MGGEGYVGMQWVRVGSGTSSGTIAIIQVRDGCTVVVVEVMISHLFIQIEIGN